MARYFVNQENSILDYDEKYQGFWDVHNYLRFESMDIIIDLIWPSYYVEIGLNTTQRWRGGNFNLAVSNLKEETEIEPSERGLLAKKSWINKINSKFQIEQREMYIKQLCIYFEKTLKTKFSKNQSIIKSLQRDERY